MALKRGRESFPERTPDPFSSQEEFKNPPESVRPGTNRFRLEATLP